MYGRKRQLYSLSQPKFLAPSYVDLDGKLHTRPADNLPLLVWPDGSWCHSANSFIRELFERNLSRRNNGGSLATAAADVTHLLRFCWGRRVDPSDLTDDQFREFIASLLKERRIGKPGQAARSPSRVVAIGRTCLQLLASIEARSGVPLLGPTGRINAVLKDHTVRLHNRSGKPRTKVVHYWHHESFPIPESKKKRSPISTENIQRLRDAVARMSNSTHLRIRRHVLIKLLEITGARRGEIADLTVESVQAAADMTFPMLRLSTFKKRSDETRLVPISRADLRFLLDYIEIHRRPVVRRKNHGPDEGFLLISDTRGTPFHPNSITHELREMALAAGIVEKTCPHMFRHRFITKLFVALIEQHKIQNPDEFRQLLIDGETFKRKVAEWTGHQNLNSLEVYIDLAFDEIGNYHKVYDVARVGFAVDGFISSLQSEIMQLRSGDTPLLVAERLLRLSACLQSDLMAAKEARDKAA